MFGSAVPRTSSQNRSTMLQCSQAWLGPQTGWQLQLTTRHLNGNCATSSDLATTQSEDGLITSCLGNRLFAQTADDLLLSLAPLYPVVPSLWSADPGDPGDSDLCGGWLAP